ncbi:MAG: IS5/IS1182 family transposase, partial [Deltaproteobacteria bacterium]|nr:IS5/IS1182 family transposase [Deltaproteobacteria bacterium]
MKKNKKTTTDLRGFLSQWWGNIQRSLFPNLQEELGPLTSPLQKVIMTLEMLRVEEFVREQWYSRGRPSSSRKAIARAFVAKAVLNLATTRTLLDRLYIDVRLRRICGFLT